MDGEELRDAIEKPALKMKVELEEGLTSKLINDVGNHPGRLPMLEFALTQLWSKQRNWYLTHQAHEEIGGLEKALTKHASEVLKLLSKAERQKAERVFIQLVCPGEGTEDTRRVATCNEVGKENWDLVKRLADARLVVTGWDEIEKIETVEIVHEALIREWRTLREWITTNREFRIWQERLKQEMRDWENSDRNPEALLPGTRLAVAEDWYKQRRDELTPREQDFIKASIKRREQEQRQQKFKRNLTIFGLTGGLVLALSLLGLTWQQSQKAAQNEIKAISEYSKALFATNKQLEALIEAIRAGQKQKSLVLGKADTETNVVQALQNLLFRIKEYNRLEGHKRGVSAVYLRPDSSMISTMDGKGTVKLWKPDGFLQNIPWLKNLKNVSAVAFSPNHQIIATASGDIVTLRTLDGKQLKTLSGQKGAVSNLAFSPNGKIIATVSMQKENKDVTVQFWNSDDGTLLETLPAGKDVVMTFAFSPKGNMIVLGGWYGFTVWKQDGTWHKVLEGQKINAAAFSPDGQTLATATDKLVNLWKANGTGGFENSPYTSLSGHTDDVWDVTFSPDGQMIATASGDKEVKLWQPDGQLVKTLSGHGSIVRVVGFSPNSQTLASGSDDGTVKLWKLHNQALLGIEHDAEAYAVAFSPDGKKIITTHGHGYASLWQNNGKLLKTDKWQGGSVSTAAFSPNGELIATASGDRSVRISKSDGTFLNNLEEHTGELEQKEVLGVSFSPDSQMIVGGGVDGAIQLWKRDGKLYKTLQPNGDIVRGVSFSPDGKLIASADDNGKVKLWKRDGTWVKTWTGHQKPVTAVAFSHDGTILATASADKTVKLWKRNASGEFETRPYKTLEGHIEAVLSVAISPDNQVIATGSKDKTVKLWKQDGTLLETLAGHEGAVRKVAFSPDGKTIASASQDKSVFLWNLDRVVDLDKVMAYGCNWVRDYLKTNPDVSESDRRLCDGIGLSSLR